MIDNELKKKVSEDWLNVFFQLSIFKQNKFYKIAGPCIIGIELIKSPFSNSYSPYFVIYPLWKKDVKTSLDYPILLKNFKNKKGFEYDIPYEKHTAFFDDVVEKVKIQTPLPLEGNISLKKLLSTLVEYSKMPPLSAAPNSYLQGALQEAILKISLFVSVEEGQYVFEQIKKRNWDLSHFKACGIDIHKWIESLQDVIVDKASFIEQVNLNKLEKKISKLKNSELIL
jgi:hypothetical protein